MIDRFAFATFIISACYVFYVATSTEFRYCWTILGNMFCLPLIKLSDAIKKSDYEDLRLKMVSDQMMLGNKVDFYPEGGGFAIIDKYGNVLDSTFYGYRPRTHYVKYIKCVAVSVGQRRELMSYVVSIKDEQSGIIVEVNAHEFDNAVQIIDRLGIEMI